MKNDAYDLESVYDEQIAPLMTQIIDICKEHKLPMFATFQFAATEDEDKSYCSTNLIFPDERDTTQALRSLAPIMKRGDGHMSAFTITRARRNP